MTENFKFHDPELAAVVRSASESFSGFQANLDQTSADIKNLEKWLAGNKICFYASVHLGDSEYIAWSDENLEWRLVYESVDDLSEDERIVTRPLIEMPVKARLKARPFLAQLVSTIAELVPKMEPPIKKPALSLFSKSSSVVSDRSNEEGGSHAQ
jgi:hypothetical protein